MIKKLTIFSFLIFSILVSSLSISAQPSFSAFWEKFKVAVKAKDKNAIATMTQFPLLMPYGVATVKNKTQLSSRFSQIFDGEANAVKCFSTEKPERESSSRYFVACGFKNGGAEADKPIVYSFELTKTGWRFVGLDNINE